MATNVEILESLSHLALHAKIREERHAVDVVYKACLDMAYKGFDILPEARISERLYREGYKFDPSKDFSQVRPGAEHLDSYYRWITWRWILFIWENAENLPPV